MRSSDNGTGAFLARYAHGDRVDQPLAMSHGGQDYYVHADHQGSVIRVTDSVGAVINSYTYDAYGQRLAALEGVEIAYGYTGREYDAESGLMYYRARTYDPAMGRFLQTDPLGFDAGDLNVYRYVFNNPVNFTDPSGAFVEITIGLSRTITVGKTVVGANGSVSLDLVNFEIGGSLSGTVGRGKQSGISATIEFDFDPEAQGKFGCIEAIASVEAIAKVDVVVVTSDVGIKAEVDLKAEKPNIEFEKDFDPRPDIKGKINDLMKGKVKFKVGAKAGVAAKVTVTAKGNISLSDLF